MRELDDRDAVGWLSDAMLYTARRQIGVHR